jgi:hypothetical protein
VEISTRENRHMAMMNKTSDWHKKIQKREPWYAGICPAMPSFKMPNFELYIERLAFFWTHSPPSTPSSSIVSSRTSWR